MTDTPLDETLARVRQHWGTLEEELHVVAFRANSLRFELVSATGAIVGLLRSSDSVRATRHRGGDVPAIPLLFDRAGALRFSFGCAEQWEARSGSRPFRFRAANLTFFMHSDDTPGPIQLFRAEWPGIREWNPGVTGPQSPGAGHPHWQFDALAHYMSEDQRRARVQKALALLSSASLDEPEDFDPATVNTATSLLAEEVVDTRWTAMHFAAGARWHRQPWSGSADASEAHVWVPAELKDIRAWVRSVVLYSREELLKAYSAYAS